jgi:hypothetical protein
LANTLVELEAELSGLSHSDDAIARVREYTGRLMGTPERARVWGSPNVLMQAAIPIEETRSLGFDSPDDAFTLLQGDVVRTASGYLYGERVELSRFLVLNASCDLVPGRSAHSTMLQVRSIVRSYPNAAALLGELLKFRRRDSMYMPVFRGDPDEVVGNALDFSPIYQIRSEDLLLAQREASLTLLGWRVFASFARTVIARANPRETDMRRAVEESRKASS